MAKQGILFLFFKLLHPGLNGVCGHLIPTRICSRCSVKRSTSFTSGVEKQVTGWVSLCACL
ncbi:rCG51019, isoform CRA_b [Rattus norvegicus]|uniref:RCG51019, isoform CRA_b n=1 Tax=Rattus norvegicus TaxID=10116 RepID=A6KGE9_RAT|nr:rCG51019, isoform CRA_b [Rattus norvegicus]